MPDSVDPNSDNSGAVARRRRSTPQVPIGLRPAPSDDELETNILERWQGLGVVLTIFLALFLPAYWLFFEQQRGSAAGIEQRTESIHRGKVIFGPTPPGVAHGFQANCAQCHGTNAEGGVKGRTWIPPGTSKPVAYQAPSLNDVFIRQTVGAKKNAKDAYNFVYETIARGRAGAPMPTWGLGYGGPMNDQQIEDVVNFLISIQPLDKLPKGIELAEVNLGSVGRFLTVSRRLDHDAFLEAIVQLQKKIDGESMKEQRTIGV